MQGESLKVLVGPNLMGLEQALPDLQESFPGVGFAHFHEREGLAAVIADADIYMGWLGRAEFLAARKLKWVQSPSSGVNAFLAIPELAGGNVLLTSASGTHATCVAESALAMILAFTRGVRASVLRQRDRVWAMYDIRASQVELTGGIMGIVGFGAIGRALAARALAFGMQVVAVDVSPKEKPADVAWLRGIDGLADLLRNSDYVVVTVPYTGETSHMIGVPQLALMKPTAMLVGMSRGGVIDQHALAQALRARRLAAAALDVFEPEPLPAGDELWDVENLLITPHIAGGTQYEAQHIIAIFRENLGRFLRGEFPLRNQVDKTLGY